VESNVTCKPSTIVSIQPGEAKKKKTNLDSISILVAPGGESILGDDTVRNVGRVTHYNG
jgi:hypothetical protein